ncbi:MAG: NAD(P)H-hydrate dehydratase [Isosphaeraceae bacterium]|nr:NAD(P)H-hydrate dehydratase [Isosphaeraceae bacterium]
MALQRVETLPTLPKRPQDSHKGMYGSILVLAGGRGMAGAAGLSGASALRSGAGLVRVASAAEVQPTVASYEPSYMTYPLINDHDGLVRFGANRATLEKLLERTDVLAVGPGLGQSDEIVELVRWVVEEVKVPTVLDADALNALAADTQILSRAKRPIVLTPHPGECARLLGTTTAEVQANRERSATDLAWAENVVVVLKGARTLVTDGTRLYVNATGNPGMATGGAGDVLTGVIAGLIGQKLPAFEAAQLGVYVHGLAGDIARDHDGEIGMIAGDIVDALADAFYHLSA